ncbi:metal ABC transporter ATP-binding protein [Oceanospirillum sp.]|uniref:metal ABC transporter ATP-binding protein n=1 Tax=Oceanospirillum sp. TaxID=2021254 RepID=UPI003A8CA264
MNALTVSDVSVNSDPKVKLGPALHLDQLSLSFGGNMLFNPVSMTLAAGQLHMLTGANGAGKSSLLKCLAGLMPHQGEICWLWPENSPNQVDKVAYIPQLEAFDATLPITVEDYLLTSIQPRIFFRKPPVKEQQRLEQLLSRVGLEQKRNRKIGQLSGGERQRLLFARALAQEATLWFLDEPMNGLDQEAQGQILQLILQLKAQGCTLLMVHHDIEFVTAHADQEVRICDGNIMVIAPAPVDDGLVVPLGVAQI